LAPKDRQTDHRSHGAAGATPLAIALKHAPAAAATPRVVASGRGLAAEQILALAFANGVKVREDADLAEMLAAVGIGDEIPFAAFSAVAEILAYIYRANHAAPSAGATMPEKDAPP
jgi:flagellar biosynthesis protein